ACRFRGRAGAGAQALRRSHSPVEHLGAVMRLRDAEILGGSAFLALGAVTIAGSVRLGVGTPNTPGPGFFSSGIGAMMTLLAAITLISALRIPKTKVAEEATFPSPLAVCVLIASMVIYALLLERAGFIACTFAFM